MTHPLDALFPSNDRIAPARPGASGDAPPPYPGEMVTVARRFNSLEAELLRGRLEADGIPATLGDPHTVQTDSLLTVALGGVRILVPTAYERQALRTVADVDGGAFALEDGADVSDDAPDATDAPGAGHASVFARVRNIGLAIIVAIVACKLAAVAWLLVSHG